MGVLVFLLQGKICQVFAQDSPVSLQVVASLYMARSDVAYTVRSAALHVWKTIVSNTPRTLAEILPALMKSIIASLASPGELAPPCTAGPNMTTEVVSPGALSSFMARDQSQICGHH